MSTHSTQSIRIRIFNRFFKVILSHNGALAVSWWQATILCSLWSISVLENDPIDEGGPKPMKVPPPKKRKRLSSHVSLCCCFVPRLKTWRPYRQSFAPRRFAMTKSSHGIGSSSIAWVQLPSICCTLTRSQEQVGKYREVTPAASWSAKRIVISMNRRRIGKGDCFPPKNFADIDWGDRQLLS